MDPLRDWSGLVPELLGEIAARIPLVEDFMAFRGVCSSWRSAASKGKFVSSHLTIPLLMLSEAEERVDDYREFYSISKGKISMRLPLPEIRNKFCMDVGFGWLLTVTNPGDCNLLNPFTRDQIQLPNFTTFPDYDNAGAPECHFYYIAEGILSANPSETPSNFTLMVVHDFGRSLGCWKPAELNWTRIEPMGGTFWDIIYHNRRFYSIDSVGGVYVWDGSGPARLLFYMDKYISYFSCTKLYLLESSKGELLVFTRDRISRLRRCECHDLLFCKCAEYGVASFKIIRLDVMKNECEEIHSLDDDAIFVGYGKCRSVPTSEFPSAIKSNCIYFTDDCFEAYVGIPQGGGKDMGIFDVKDLTIERFKDIKSFDIICPPVWITL